MTDRDDTCAVAHDVPRSRSDAVPVSFPWGEIRWLVNGALDAEAEMTFGTVKIGAGARNDLHMHPNCEEIIFVIEGECRHRLGEEEFPMPTGTALRIPRGVWHCATAADHGPCTMVIAYSSPDRQTVFSGDGG